jgi:hypothetical protein
MGDPLAAGKPFVNNFLPNGGDMLRLNMAVPVTPRNSADFSAGGLIQAAVLGLTDARFNTNTNIENIPNMDGFPNGRRLEDDVTKIELQAVSGAVLAAIGLWYDDYTAGGANPVTQDLLDVLTYDTGINANDTTFKSVFPYVQTPWSGTGPCSGKAVIYNQPGILVPTAIEDDEIFQPLTVYPSPARGQLNIKLTSEVNRPVTVEVYNITGQRVYTSSVNTFAGENEITVKLDDLVTGAYFVKISRDKALLGSAKFLKE